MGAHVAGELAYWPTKDKMAAILRDGGLRVQVGRDSIRVGNCTQFVFGEFDGDLGDPIIEAEAKSVEEMTRDAQLVSDALARADVAHRFEIYDDRDKLSGCLQHYWPPKQDD